MPYASFRRKPESSVSEELKNVWTPFFNGVTTSHEAVNFKYLDFDQKKLKMFDITKKAWLCTLAGFLLRENPFVKSGNLKLETIRIQWKGGCHYG